MLHTPFYNPEKTYQENFDQGPFGALSDGQKIPRVGKPTKSFFKHAVYLPFGIPAGPLITSKFVATAFEKGFDICVYKTVRTRAYPCHAWPNVLGVKIRGDLTIKKAQESLLGESSYSEPLSITNSFGVPSMSPDWWQEDMARAVRSAGEGQVLVGSFQGTKKEGGTAQDLIEDYVLAAELVVEAGAKIVEANLSCPNEGTTDLLCFDTERVAKIAEKIKNKIGDIPLILKLAYFGNEGHLQDFVQRVGVIADGLSVINTIPAAIINEAGEQALPGEGRLRSGVCGAGIKWAGLEMVGRVAALRAANNLTFSIIGVGGVTTSTDFFEYQAAGADVSMSATGAMWNPFLAQEIEKQKNRNI